MLLSITEKNIVEKCNMSKVAEVARVCALFLIILLLQGNVHNAQGFFEDLERAGGDVAD